MDMNWKRNGVATLHNFHWSSRSSFGATVNCSEGGGEREWAGVGGSGRERQNEINFILFFFSIFWILIKKSIQQRILFFSSSSSSSFNFEDDKNLRKLRTRQMKRETKAKTKKKTNEEESAIIWMDSFIISWFWHVIYELVGIEIFIAFDKRRKKWVTIFMISFFFFEMKEKNDIWKKK